MNVVFRILTFLFVFFFCVGTREMMKRSMRNEICKNQMRKIGYHLTPPLLHLCQEELDIFPSAVTGFENGITECKETFRKERWNCTTLPDVTKHELFGTVMARGMCLIESDYNKSL